MQLDPAQLPDDVATLKAMLVVAASHTKDLDAEIANLKLTIAKLQHASYGASSERGNKLLDQLELQPVYLIEKTGPGREGCRAEGRC